MVVIFFYSIDRVTIISNLARVYTFLQLFLIVLCLFEFIFRVIVWIDKLHDSDERICFSNNDCHRTGKKKFSVIIVTTTKKIELIESVMLSEKCQYSELFWSVFFRTRTEYGEIWSISPYSVGMQENTEDQVLPQGFSGFSFFIQTNGLIDT